MSANTIQVSNKASPIVFASASFIPSQKSRPYHYHCLCQGQYHTHLMTCVIYSNDLETYCKSQIWVNAVWAHVLCIMFYTLIVFQSLVPINWNDFPRRAVTIKRLRLYLYFCTTFIKTFMFLYDLHQNRVFYPSRKVLFIHFITSLLSDFNCPCYCQLFILPCIRPTESQD